MKKKLFLILAVAAVAFSACLRDDDLALLKKPIHLQGQMDPTFGAPVAYGKMTLHDILGMLSRTYTGYINDTSEVITINFDTTVTDTLRDIIPNSIFDKKTTKDDPIFIALFDTTLDYSVNITLFDGVEFDQMLGDGNIEIGDLWLDLHAIVKAIVRSGSQLEQYISDENKIRSKIDNFKIYYTTHDGIEKQFNDTVIPDETLRHLVLGDTIERTKINLKSIVNTLPKKIRVNFHYDFYISNEFLVSSDWAYVRTQMKEDIKNIKVYYNVNLFAEFPFDIKINRLPYDFTINFNGDSLPSLDIQQTLDSISRGLSVDLNDAKITFNFGNGIPANIDISVFLLDSNNAVIRNDTLIPNSTIAAAPVTGPDASGHYISNGSRTTVISAQLDEQRLRDLKKARRIGFKFAVSTKNNGTNHVAIRRTDYLSIKAFVMVHPQASVDITVTNQGLLK